MIHRHTYNIPIHIKYNLKNLKNVSSTGYHWLGFISVKGNMMDTCRHTIMVCMWRIENNFVESIPSIHFYQDPTDITQVMRLIGKTSLTIKPSCLISLIFIDLKMRVLYGNFCFVQHLFSICFVQFSLSLYNLWFYIWSWGKNYVF